MKQNSGLKISSNSMNFRLAREKDSSLKLLRSGSEIKFHKNTMNNCRSLNEATRQDLFHEGKG